MVVHLTSCVVALGSSLVMFPATASPERADHGTGHRLGVALQQAIDALPDAWQPSLELEDGRLALHLPRSEDACESIVDLAERLAALAGGPGDGDVTVALPGQGGAWHATTARIVVGAGDLDVAEPRDGILLVAVAGEGDLDRPGGSVSVNVTGSGCVVVALGGRGGDGTAAIAHGGDASVDVEGDVSAEVIARGGEGGTVRRSLPSASGPRALRPAPIPGPDGQPGADGGDARITGPCAGSFILAIGGAGKRGGNGDNAAIGIDAGNGGAGGDGGDATATCDPVGAPPCEAWARAGDGGPGGHGGHGLVALGGGAVIAVPGGNGGVGGIGGDARAKACCHANAIASGGDGGRGGGAGIGCPGGHGGCGGAGGNGDALVVHGTTDGLAIAEGGRGGSGAPGGAGHGACNGGDGGCGEDGGDALGTNECVPRGVLLVPGRPGQGAQGGNGGIAGRRGDRGPNGSPGGTGPSRQ